MDTLIFFHFERSDLDWKLATCKRAPPPPPFPREILGETDAHQRRWRNDTALLPCLDPNE